MSNSTATAGGKKANTRTRGRKPAMPPGLPDLLVEAVEHEGKIAPIMVYLTGGRSIGFNEVTLAGGEFIRLTYTDSLRGRRSVDVRASVVESAELIPPPCR